MPDLLLLIDLSRYLIFGVVLSSHILDYEGGKAPVKYYTRLTTSCYWKPQEGPITKILG